MHNREPEEAVFLVDIVSMHLHKLSQLSAKLTAEGDAVQDLVASSIWL
jgi:hypothetical protein